MDRLYRIEHHGRSGSAVERDGTLRELSGDPFGSYTAGAAIAGGLKAAGLTLLPPVTPSKVVCVGLNYKDHAAETGGADAGLRSEAMTSALSLSSSLGVNFDSCLG